ncbi:UNKNOWN [Stylonychia lemnae]|uniref:Uncharacterized protein n=1 Tax=Stylonychia lemnae TaxID=5949 RepID=A0A077ZNY8_STYLE|nr:UNKNOWN [Stylonychia lemnae]|eukprot:CDW71628.1 UNKNOWN [Stylonychia lemnae]
MLQKIIVLASVAVVTSASALFNLKNHYDSLKAISGNETWPQVNLPYENKATCRVYTWDDASKTLIDRKVFGQAKFSASLNHEWASQGTVDSEGNLITSEISVTNHNSKKIIEYRATPKYCGSEESSSNDTVKEIVDRAFDPSANPRFQFAGQQAPVWDLTTQYNVINNINLQGQPGSSYYYRIDTGAIRYIVELGSETRVYDYGEGFVETKLTIKDFLIQQCLQRLFLE